MSETKQTMRAPFHLKLHYARGGRARHSLLRLIYEK